MSDTPRTDDAMEYDDTTVDDVMDFARTLERELNAASKERDDALAMLGTYRMKSDDQKQRIKELEALVNDPEVLWTNWLRGTVKLPSGIGDVRQYQERIKRLEEVGDEMATWLSSSRNLGDDPFMSHQWRKAKEAKP